MSAANPAGPVLRPHLVAAGAGLARVRILKPLIDEGYQLRDLVDDGGNARHRRLLDPLAALALRHGLAIVLVHRLAKGTRRWAGQMLQGSGAYRNVARALYLTRCPIRATPTGGSCSRRSSTCWDDSRWARRTDFTGQLGACAGAGPCHCGTCFKAEHPEHRRTPREHRRSLRPLLHFHSPSDGHGGQTYISFHQTSAPVRLTCSSLSSQRLWGSHTPGAQGTSLCAGAQYNHCPSAQCFPLRVVGSPSGLVIWADHPPRLAGSTIEDFGHDP